MSSFLSSYLRKNGRFVLEVVLRAQNLVGLRHTLYVCLHLHWYCSVSISGVGSRLTVNCASGQLHTKKAVLEKSLLHRNIRNILHKKF